MMSTGGQKNIESIQPGDKVVSESESGQKSVSTVASLETPVSNNLCTINYTDGNKLDLTKNHPIFTSLGWKAIDPISAKKEIPSISVSKLLIGDIVKKDDNSYSTVASFSCKDENIQTYNLSLSGDNHTYFANDYLVHNKGGCFVPGTLVKTSGGSEKIEDVKVGDKVTSFDDKTGEVKDSIVTDLHQVYRDYYFSLIAGGYNVKVTAEHPFYIGSGQYKEAQDIKTGDILYVDQNNILAPVIVAENVKINEPTPAYNLTVDNTHTFFANGFAVHNKGICGGCGDGADRTVAPVSTVTITKKSATAAHISWDAQGQSCADASNFVVFVGTDPRRVTNNCFGCGADYPGNPGVASTDCADKNFGSSNLPNGCLYERVVGGLSGSGGTASLDTDVAGMALAPNTTYYIKVASTVRYKDANDENVQDICGGPYAAFLGSCPLNPNPATMSVGGPTATFTTGIDPNSNYSAQPFPTVKYWNTVPDNAPGHQNCVTNDKEVEVCRPWILGISFTGYDYGSGSIHLQITDTVGRTYSGDATITNYPDGHDSALVLKQALVNAGFPFTQNDVGAQFPPGDMPYWTVTASYNANTTQPSRTYNIWGVLYSKPVGENYINITSTNPDTTPADTYFATVMAALKTTYSAAHLISSVYAFGLPPPSAPSCVDYNNITVNDVSNDPWWQVRDSDIQSNGDLTSKIPASQFFGDKGSGDYPGVPAYAGSTNLTTANASQIGWLANSPWTSPKVFNYAFFENIIPSDWVINGIDSDGVPAASNPSPDGYIYYKYDGSSSGLPLTISSPLDVGSNKSILLVKNANLVINAPISLTDGSGFFMAIVNGNISVSPEIGGYATPTLKGLYVADGTFSDGTLTPLGDKQLWVRGSVVANGGVNIQRDLLPAGNSAPAELFEYAPDQMLFYPSTLGYRKINWKEVAP